MSEHWVKVDGESRLRGVVYDHGLHANRPEMDAECIERVRREAEEAAHARVRAGSDEGKLDDEIRALLRPYTQPIVVRGCVLEGKVDLGGVSRYLALSLLKPAQEAEDALAAARKPGEDAWAAAYTAKRALKLTATAGMLPTASEEEIAAAMSAHEAAIQRVAVLEERAKLLTDAIDPQLAVDARRKRDLADKAVEERRRGQLRVPLPESARFVWNPEVEGALLADLFHKCPDVASAIYSYQGGLNLPSGTPTPSLRALWSLAGMSTEGRSFDDDGCGPQDRQRGISLVESNDFQRALSNQLCGALSFRFNLSLESGRAHQKRDATWGPKPDMLGQVGGRAM